MPPLNVAAVHLAAGVVFDLMFDVLVCLLGVPGGVVTHNVVPRRGVTPMSVRRFVMATAVHTAVMLVHTLVVVMQPFAAVLMKAFAPVGVVELAVTVAAFVAMVATPQSRGDF